MRTGEYKFDPKLLGEAHADCLSRFVQAVKERKHRIILANTSTRYWEYCNYTAISEMVGYTTVVADMVPATVKEIKLCADRNVHGVDAATVAAQTLRFTPDPRATRVCIETEL